MTLVAYYKNRLCFLYLKVMSAYFRTKSKLKTLGHCPMSKTLYDKLWDEHVVTAEGDGTATIYIDRHLMHEVTSPQAFEGLRLAGRKPWRESSIVATADHNTPTTGWEKGLAGITDPIALLQVETLDKNMKSICPAAYFPFMDKGQGVIHVMGPEEGATLPGMTVVCGDSHTSTHGACAALAFGIGTSEVEHVLATQTPARISLWQSSARSVRPAERAARLNSRALRSVRFRWKAA